MNNFIHIPIRGHWDDVNKTLIELESSGYKVRRGPVYLSGGATEFLTVIIENTPDGLLGIAAIIAAWIRGGKRIKFKMKDGKVDELDAKNATEEEIVQLCKDMQELQMDKPRSTK